MNKVRACCENPLKNKHMARQLQTTMMLLNEHLLPFYLIKNKNNYDEIKNMHNLCYLLSQKI
jgi:hypothetical protein